MTEKGSKKCPWCSFLVLPYYQSTAHKEQITELNCMIQGGDKFSQSFSTVVVSAST